MMRFNDFHNNDNKIELKRFQKSTHYIDECRTKTDRTVRLTAPRAPLAAATAARRLSRHAICVCVKFLRTHTCKVLTVCMYYNETHFTNNLQ